jgi:hypothetical protein
VVIRMQCWRLQLGMKACVASDSSSMAVALAVPDQLAATREVASTSWARAIAQ